MKKIFFTFAMIMATIITMAQSQFYVIMKDGSGASYPEEIVDSLTFDNNNGAKIYGFEDLIKRLNALESKVAMLEKNMNGGNGDNQDPAFEHPYVDLGLPSGTLWATCNLGALTSEEYGYYICWGELDQKSNYSLTGGKWNGKSQSELQNEGVVDADYNLTEKYDAATALWGDDWKIPSANDFEELLNFCTLKWTEVNGNGGILFTSIFNAKTIFMPCAGMIRDNEKTLVGTRGYYIGATASETTCASLYMAQGDAAGEVDVRTGTASRSHGRTIRPVRKKKVDEHEYIDLGLPSGTLWARTNLIATSSFGVGSLFTWGDSTKRTESVNEESIWLNYTDEELLEKGVIDESGNLTPEYDPATLHWGENWKTPTEEDVRELFSNCKAEIKVYKGEPSAALLTGPNGNTILFVRLFGYWTATSTGVHTAIEFYFDDDNEKKDPLHGSNYHSCAKDVNLMIRPVVRK